MERSPRLGIRQRDPQHRLNDPQPLVERRPRHVRSRSRQRLVPPRLKEHRQIPHQPRPVRRVVS